jgi:hypothetical protein
MTVSPMARRDHVRAEHAPAAVPPRRRRRSRLLLRDGALLRLASRAARDRGPWTRVRGPADRSTMWFACEDPPAVGVRGLDPRAPQVGLDRRKRAGRARRAALGLVPHRRAEGSSTAGADIVFQLSPRLSYDGSLPTLWMVPVERHRPPLPKGELRRRALDHRRLPRHA